MQQFQTSLDVIGNNIANSNTTGFKSARTDFADALSQTIKSASPSTATTSGTSGVEVGTGVQTISTQNNFSQGGINGTGVASDLALAGNGFFVVKDPASSASFATRAGDFHLDDKGYLVTNGGARVQGYTDSTLATVGDIQIDGTGAANPAATFNDYTIDAQGNINVHMSDGTSFVRGQVLLQSFTNEQALAKQGDNLYSWVSDAGPLAALSAAGTNGLGIIKSEALESSNVDLTSEFANMITSQRAFQASARVITTSDEILQEIVGLKR